jgi:hypothetical protein
VAASLTGCKAEGATVTSIVSLLLAGVSFQGCCRATSSFQDPENEIELRQEPEGVLAPAPIGDIPG